MGDLMKSMVAKLSINNSESNFYPFISPLVIHSSIIQPYQINSFTASVIDINSDFIVDKHTFFCFEVRNMIWL